MPKLPIGVVLPTRNAVALLPDHLAAMQPWLQSVQEVVVVDSGSNDGTWEMLRDHLRHSNLKLLQHPPGLYQSWNHGIAQLSSEFCYISTVGETVTPEGLAHMTELMRTFTADVVISKPAFRDFSGNPCNPPRWPIDDFIQTLQITRPIALEGAALFLMTLLNYRDAILGSSASNLYRTSCIQAHPFPTEYGTAGDGGWGLTHCLSVRLAITAQVFTTFRDHPKAYPKSEYAVDKLSEKMLHRIEKTFLEHLAAAPALAEPARALQVKRILSLSYEKLAFQQALERYRAGAIPWAINPAAWVARIRRSARERELRRIKFAAIRSPHFKTVLNLEATEAPARKPLGVGTAA